MIIPSYNEEDSIARLLESALEDSNIEVIVSDGGSNDRTIDICGQYPIQLVCLGRNRSECIKHGADIATGDILLFVHADSILPPNWGCHVRHLLAGFFAISFYTLNFFRIKISVIHLMALDSSVLIGAFSFSFFDSDLLRFPGLYIVMLGTNLRSFLFSTPYGDQGLFMHSTVYKILGGFPVQPLMEDYDFILRARRVGQIRLLNAYLQTSARRWLSKGCISNTLFNQIVILGHSLGVPHERLAGWYYGTTTTKAY